ncbi:hypothetical protein CSUI_004244, partial [Cystoisospora suis]
LIFLSFLLSFSPSFCLSFFSLKGENFLTEESSFLRFHSACLNLSSNGQSLPSPVFFLRNFSFLSQDISSLSISSSSSSCLLPFSEDEERRKKNGEEAEDQQRKERRRERCSFLFFSHLILVRVAHP